MTDDSDEWFTLPDFTGNWFIDANIYGFYRCIKNSGISDPSLIKEEKDGKIKYHNKIVYGVYPIFYCFYHNDLVAENTTEQKHDSATKFLCNKFLEHYEKTTDNTADKSKIFDSAMKYTQQKYIEFSKKSVEKIYATNLELHKELAYNSTKTFGEKKNTDYGKQKKGKTKIQTLKEKARVRPSFGKNLFYTNYSFMNPSLKSWDEFNKKFKAHFPLEANNDFDAQYKELLDKPGNKFLPSKKEFSFGSFSTEWIGAHKVVDTGCYPFVLLNYHFGMSRIRKRNIFFYSPNRELTILVNNKFGASDITKKSIFPQITNSLMEIRNKTWFSLNQMYLIEYEITNKQELLFVSYIGFPIFIARILTSEKAVSALNKSFLVRKGKKLEVPTYLLQEVIDGNPITPAYLRYSPANKKKESDRNVFRPNMTGLAIDCLRFDRTASKKKNPYEEVKHANELEDLNRTEKKLRKFKKMASALFKNSTDKNQISQYLIRLVGSGRLADFNYALSKQALKSDVDSRAKNSFSEFLKDNCRENYWPAYSSAVIAGLA